MTDAATTPAQDATPAAATATPAATPATRPDNIPEKFWDADKGAVNTEALLQSYTELEKMASSKAAKPDADKPDPNAPTPDKDALDADAKAADAALKGSGLSLSEFTAEFAQNGALSDASYEALEAAGFPRDFVDSHIEGQVALGKMYTDAAMEAAGGEDAYSKMTAWAKTNMKPAEIDAYNKGVMGSKAAMVKAVQELRQRYESATGKEPSLLQGNGPASGDAFASQDEVNNAIRDPRWGKDKAYTATVTAKIARSKY